MNGVTLVQPYNPNWPSWFERMKAFLEPVLAEVPHTIEHIGSTAIPGMTAKPIIDIDIVVERLVLPLVKERLATLGYLHQGDLGIPDRDAFTLTDPRMKEKLPPHHLYVCITGAAALRDHRCFRDCLREQPELVQRLSEHKVQLCRQYDNDRQSYIDGKAAMVRAITACAIDNMDAVPTRPPLFERSAAAFWDDPYISTQMLKFHIDPSHDIASRRPEIIEQITAWITTQLGLTPGKRLLDLGCGPGLYCRRFAEAGLQVTGLDYSRNSIAYATADAAQHHLPITYQCGNYLELHAQAAFDAITLIYFDFGALTDTERACLLPRIHRALEPGGRFVFDIRTSADFTRQQEARTWDLQPQGGFWHADPYLELKETLLYPEAETILYQYAIMPDAEEIRPYRIWERCFSLETITALLAEHGFTVESVWSDLSGCPWGDTSPTMGVIAKKR